MKKTSVFLSVICLLVLTLAVSASAATITHYEENFNDITVSIDSSSSSTEKEAFESATGLDVQQIRNSVEVSTVTATDENASWTGRGKVLKLDGTADPGRGKLRLQLPFDGKFSKTDYDTKLYIEYDLYLDSTSADKYNIFDGDSDHRWEYNSSAGTLNRIMDKYPSSESSAALSTNADFGSLSADCSANAWVHFRHEISNVQTDGSYYVTNATIKATNLSTNATSTLTGRIFEELYENSNLLLGGYQRNLSGVFYIDNVNIYTKDKFKFESSDIEGVTNVRKETSSFEFTMNDVVDEESLSTITLSTTGGTVEIDDPYLTNGGKTIHVDIIGSLEYGKDYTVNFEDITSGGDEIYNAKKSFTFSTEAPELYLSSYKVIKGVGAEAVEYSAFVADGSLYTFEATIKNSLATDKELTVLVGLYDSEDNLVDTASICKVIAAEGEEVYSVGLTIPAGLTGGNVKAFLWDNLDSLQAYDEQIEIEIAASGDETALSSIVDSTPDVELSELSLKKGFFGVADVANITEAKDNTIRVSTTVTGSTEGTVFFGVYKNDVLVSLAYIRKTFDGEENVSASLLVPAASESDSLELKVFSCKDITDLTVVNLPSAE